MHMLVGKTVQGEQHEQNLDFPQKNQQLLRDFKDLAADKLPMGLPPLRSIHHTIDLIAGTIVL